MAITKLDLYNPGWLELVFDNKNKDYGAYDLRKHYAGNLVKSMAIAFFSVAVLYTGYTVLKPKPELVEIRNFDGGVKPMIYDVKPPVVVPPKPQTIKPPVQVTTVRFPIPKVVPDEQAENPPKLIDLDTKAIGPENKKGTGDGVNIDIPETGTGDNGMKDVVEDTRPKETYEIQVLPQPFGGEAAWAKFLQKNLHYPAAAIDARAQGKVFLSFIVEKDGHISSIVVERGVGFGLDEEAVRVLKLAPAWKPGIQNGHQVRVKFNMPISFQLTDPD
jgi:periplasmic protein TonB